MVERRRVPFTDKQLTELYERGLSDPEIASELGVKREAVKYQRKKLGLLRSRLFTDQELVDLHQEGYNDREMAERLGASEEVVFYHRSRLGLEANRYKNQNKPFTDRLVALHKKGLNDSEIANRLGVSNSKVYSRRKKLGLESNYRLRFTDQRTRVGVVRRDHMDGGESL